MFKGRLKIRAYTLLLAALLAVASILLLESLVRSPAVQREILERLTSSTGYEITSGPMELTLWRGLALDARDVNIKSPDYSLSLTADHLRLVVDPVDLLRGRVTPTRFGMTGADVTVAEAVSFNGDRPRDFSKTAAACFAGLLRLPPVTVDKTRVDLGGRELLFEDLYLETERTGPDGKGRGLSAGGEFVSEGYRTPVRIDGEVFKPEGDGEDRFAFDLTVHVPELEIGSVPDIRWFSFSGGSGAVKASITGTLPGEFSFDGKIETEELRGRFSTEGRGFPLDFDSLASDFSGEFSGGVFEFHRVNLKAPEWSLAGNATLEPGDGKLRAASLNFHSPPMAYRHFKRLVPAEYVPGRLNEEILRRMSGGEVKVDRFVLNGSVEEIRRFNLSATPSVFELMLVWEGISFEPSGAKLPFEGVRGRLDLSGGELELSDLEGDFAGSRVREGVFSMTPLLNPRRFAAGLEGSFRLQDLSSQLTMDLIPRPVLDFVSPVESVKGTATGMISAEYLPDGPGFRVLEAEFGMVDCAISHRDIPLQIKIDQGRILLEKTGAVDFDGSGTLGSSVVSTKGSFDLSGLFEADVDALVDVNELISLWRDAGPAHRVLTGPAPVTGSVSAVNGGWEADGEVFLSGLGFDLPGFSLEFSEGDDRLTFSAAGLFNGPVELTGAVAVPGGSRVELAGSWDPSEREAVAISMSSENFNPADAGLRFSGFHGTLPDMVSGELHLVIPVRAPGDIEIDGTLAGEYGKDKAVFNGVHLEDCKFRVQFKDGSMLLESLEVSAAGGVFNAAGHITIREPWSGAFSVRASGLVLSDFIPEDREMGIRDLLGDESGFLRNSDVTVSWVLDEVAWKRMIFDRVEAETHLSGETLHFNSFIIKWEHGLVEGQGAVSLGRDRTADFSGHMEMEAQPVEALFDIFKSDSRVMTGALTMEAVYSISGGSFDELVKNVIGGANVAIEQGVIFESKIIFRVLERLSLQQIFRGRPSNVPREGFYFELMEGYLNFGGGLVEIEPAGMRSPVFNATAVAKVALDDWSVDCDLYVHPLGTMDSLVSRIPLLGYILAGDDQSLLVYRFNVTGRVTAPEVQYVPLRDLGKTFTGYLKRLLETPGRMYRSLSDAVQENDAPGELPGL